MSPGPKCFQLIKESEGCSLVSYQDQGGRWTIGYGATGPGIVGNQIWTQTEAECRLESDVHNVWRIISPHIKVELNQNQVDAITSLAFNIGPHSIEGSTLLARLNESKFDEAAEQFLVWDKVGGLENEGLLNRRKREQALFLASADENNT